MAAGNPMRVLCIYRVRKGQEQEFQRLLEKHWPTLNSLGLTTAEPAAVLWCEDKMGKSFFAEQFAWKDGSAPETAHHTPAVMAVWEPMGALCEGMEFMATSPVPMPYAAVANE